MLSESDLVSWLREALPDHHAQGYKCEPSESQPGHPDLRIVVSNSAASPGASFLVECKVHHGGRVNLEPSQIAWHVRESRAGGAPAFVLAADTSTSKLRLWPGAQTTIVRLAQKPASRVAALGTWTWVPAIRKQDVARSVSGILLACTTYCAVLAAQSRLAPRA